MSESFGEAMQRLQTQAGQPSEHLQEISQALLDLAVVDELDPLFQRVSAIMGEHTCKEIISDVWEHTFTPPDMPMYTSQESCGSLTLEDFRRFAQECREEGPEPPFELFSPAEYARRRLPLSQETLAELSKPMDMMSYLRYCYDITVEVPPVGLRPQVAEGTGTRNRKRPWTGTRIANRRYRWLKAHIRAQRRAKQHRAAFRRRKRGLA